MTKRAARRLFIACGLFSPAIVSPALAQTTVNGNVMALQSSGAASGTNWMLSSDGYVGTYITLSQPTAVSFAVNADGTTSNGLSPDMTVLIANSSQSFTVSNTSMNAFDYTTPIMPAGTYFVRTQLDNQSSTQSPTLTIGSETISGSGVTVTNSNTSTNALAAATSYAQNFREGSATFTLSNGSGVHLGAGTQVQVKLADNDFNFAAAVYGVSPFSSPAVWLNYNTTTGQNLAPVTSEQINYQKSILANFNMIVPANAGKWVNEEFTQGSVNNTMLDAMVDFANQNGLGVRMHNLIWSTEQPSFVTNLFSGTPGSLTAANKNTLNADITSRINYYVNGGNVPLGTPRTDSYAAMDVLNEPFHTQNAQDDYISPNALGVSGVANVYAQVAKAVAAANGNTVLYTNEYNVLQFSPAAISTTGVATGSDPYANWYLNGIQSIQRAGGPIGGVGMELYTNAGTNVSPQQMEEAMENLSVAKGPTGQPIQLSLTEFGVSSGQSPTAANYDTDLTDALTMIYGDPQATTFGYWGGVGGPGDNPSNNPYALYTSTYQLTTAGQTYQAWMNQYNTNLTLTTDANGDISFHGTYGLYDVIVNGVTYQADLVPGTTNYGLMTPISTATWTGAAQNSNWSQASNWTPSLVANAPLVFSGTLGLAPNNDSTAGVAYSGITFSANAGAFTLGGNSIDLTADIVNNSSNLQTVNLPLVLEQNTNINASSGDVAIGGAVSGSFGLTKIGAQTATLSNVNGYAGPTTVNAGTLIVGTVGAIPNNTAVAVNGGLLQFAAGTGKHGISSLSVAPGAAVDLTNNSLAIDFGNPGNDPTSTIVPLLASGYNGGAWNGPGIGSSNAASSSGKFALGYANGNTDSGTPAAVNQLLIQYTLDGDANLDGTVGFSDLVSVAENFGATGRDWSQGNFTYDPNGSVGFADLVIVAEQFGDTTGLSGGSVGGRLSPLWAAGMANISATAVVPEPVSTTLLAAGAAVLLARRRSRRSASL